MYNLSVGKAQKGFHFKIIKMYETLCNFVKTCKKTETVFAKYDTTAHVKFTSPHVKFTSPHIKFTVSLKFTALHRTTTNGEFVACISPIRSEERVELRTVSQLVQNVSSPQTIPSVRSTARMERVRFLHDVHDRFVTSDGNTEQRTITVERPSPAISSRTPSTGKSDTRISRRSSAYPNFLSVADILRDVDG